MSGRRFHADTSPSHRQLEELAERYPDNPFCTAPYARAREAGGCTSCLLTIREGESLIGGCIGLIRTGRFHRHLEIASAPVLPAAELFWQGLVDFCRSLQVTKLDINTFASRLSEMPALDGQMSRRSRTEHLLELNREWAGAVSANHHRNIRRARKLGVSIIRSSGYDGLREHIALMKASMDRRSSRGEDVSGEAAADSLSHFLAAGAGELFQATLAGAVVSSILILTSARGGYYHSAGTSPEGMSAGASHYLVYSVAEELRDRRFDILNLGGTSDDQAGLIRFKAGFGSVPIKLEAMHLELGSRFGQLMSAITRRFAPQI